jgi:hypothetical protein
MQSHQPFQGNVQLILLFSNTLHFSLNFTNCAYIVVQTATPIGPKTKKAAPGAAFLGLGSRVGETNAIEILASPFLGLSAFESGSLRFREWERRMGLKDCRVHFWVSPLTEGTDLLFFLSSHTHFFRTLSSVMQLIPTCSGFPTNPSPLCSH